MSLPTVKPDTSVVEKWQWSDWKYHFVVCLEDLRQNHENTSKVIRCSGHDSNP
jgi:hypothetical protein